MRNLLLLISSLDYSGPARRLCLLANGLARAAFHVRVVVLQTITPWVEELRQAGIAVDVLGWKRPFDVMPFYTLRTLLQAERPDVVHAFGPATLRAVKLLGVRGVRVLGSDLLHGGCPSRGWIVDRWLLSGPSRLLAFGAAEAMRYQCHGVAAKQIVQVTPGIGVDSVIGELLGWPAGRVILGVGPIEAHKGFRDAIWAFDILHYLFDDLRLALLGDGWDRPRVEEFARAVGATERVAFLGRQPNVEAYLRRASVVWIPSCSGGGMCAALEAMRAGRPVVATRLPELEEIIIDGETGYLVTPGDKAALARQTRFLLDDADRMQRFGAAGKKRVEERFDSERMVAECAAIYDKLPG